MLQTAPGLADQVYQAILEDICNGVLKPGAHLVQEQLAEQFGVSRQPVQQAMALLKADAMVEESGRRGLRVAAIDIDLMRHHYDIRASLDALAARRAAERVRNDPSLAAGIAAKGRAILEAGARAVEGGSYRDQIGQDERFHTLVYEASGNPLLPRTAETHWRFLRRVMGEVLRQAEPPRTIWRQHREILEAIVSGDPDLAEALAGDHIRNASATLARAMDMSEGLPA